MTGCSKKSCKIAGVESIARRAIIAVLLCIALKSPPALADGLLPSNVSVGAIEIPVSNLDRLVQFYRDVLTFSAVTDSSLVVGDDEKSMSEESEPERVMLQLGSERIVLVEAKGRPVPMDSRSHDRWFQHLAIVTSDMDRAYEHLRRHRVEHVSSGPQRLPEWNIKAAGIRAFYFRDPDRHTLEIIQFPQGKGSPRWQESEGELFQGIDHTAIVVADTEASLAFYRDRLGLEQVGESENYGVEQERLNNVFNARLRITSLKAKAGPGIELLEYLSPHDGRNYPNDTQNDDLWCWKTRLLLADASTASLFGTLQTASGAPPHSTTKVNNPLQKGAEFEQSRRANGKSTCGETPIPLPQHALEFQMVLDPDGHRLKGRVIHPTESPNVQKP